MIRPPPLPTASTSTSANATATASASAGTSTSSLLPSPSKRDASSDRPLPSPNGRIISSSSVPGAASSRKGKEREREKDRPSMSSREVGSATIQLRRDAVNRLVDEEEDELDPTERRRSRSLHPGSFAPHSGPASSQARSGGGAGGTSVGGMRSIPGFADFRLPQQVQSPSPKRGKAAIHFWEPAGAAAPAPSPELLRRGPLSGLRRQRAKSLHFPSETTGIDQNFYLPHFSLDREYSLKPDSSLHTRHGHPVNLELGLGDDFDASFGEALRRGVGGEELPLPKEALRVLSEAKENLDASVLSKKARKGSLGMGLFRESRDPLMRKKDKEKDKDKLDEVIEEGPSPSSPTRMASRAAAGSRPTPLPSRSQTQTMSEENLSEATSASIQIVSSPRRRRPSSQANQETHLNDALEAMEFDDDSGWTSSSTGSFTDVDKDELSPTDTEDEGSGSDGPEEKKLTVPLQPFGHAVGGHSSIYQFTRRAVCKPLVSGENKFYEDVELLAPALLPFIPRYLGVMVVNIRHVNYATPNGAEALSPAISAPPTPGVRPLPSHSASTHGAHSSVEVPEVSLGFNRHVVPDWLFKSSAREERGRPRGRFARQSSDEDSTHQRSTLRPSSAKSADFVRPGSLSPSSSYGHMSILSASPSLRAPNSPAISVPHPIREDEPATPAPSPANSPLQNPQLHHTISTPQLPRPLRLDTLFAGHEGPVSGYSSPHPSFGGTGSTTVNTKLKDHVFATILKRLKKKGIHVPHRNDGDADDEGDENCHPHAERFARRRGDHIASGTVEFSRLDKGKAVQEHGQGDVRRTQSDVILHGRHARREREESEERGLFAMEEDDDKEQLSMRSKRGSHRGPHSMRANARDIPLLTPMTPVRTGTLSKALEPAPESTTGVAAPVSVSHVPRTSTSTPTPSGHEDGRQELFIFMEDLTGRLKRPCVVDLKMGTRQYGCDATPKKMESQRKKCDETTSRSLGVRMCGMQLWNNETEQFLSKDKYIGRKIQTADFKRILRRYLLDGDKLLYTHIPVVIQKLHTLAAIMLRLDGFRFYGCSLLLIYDGDKETQEHYARHVSKHQQVEGGDVSHDEEVGEEYAEHRHRPTATGIGQYAEMKEEAVKGRRSRSVEAHGHHGRHGPSQSQSDSHSHSHSRSQSQHSQSHSQAQSHGQPMSSSGHRKTRGELTIRLVDFAHTTTGREFVILDPSVQWEDASVLGKGYDTKYDAETGLAIARFPPKHRDAPDMGFIFGLKSICAALRQIWADEALGPLEVAEDEGVFGEAFRDWDEGELST